MLIDDSICENCLAKNHCDVLHYSNNCNEVRAMAKHDRQVYNKAIDDFVEKLIRYVDCGHLCSPTEMRWSDLTVVEMVKELAEQLKAGGENEQSI